MAKTLMGLCLITLFLSGCAGKLVGKIPVVENDNYSTVNIARPAGYAGCGMRMTIQIDYTDFYYLACGDCITFRVPAGKPTTISQTTSTKADHIEIDAKRGNEYYFENDCNGWACWLQKTTEPKYKQLSNRCNNSINLGF